MWRCRNVSGGKVKSRRKERGRTPREAADIHLKVRVTLAWFGASTAEPHGKSYIKNRVQFVTISQFRRIYST